MLNSFTMANWFSIYHIISVLATTALLLFVVLNGITSKAPLNNIYWSQVEFSPNQFVRYTNYGACITNSTGHILECSSRHFAYGYQPVAGIANLDTDLFKYGDLLYTLSITSFYLLFIALICSVIALAFSVVDAVSFKLSNICTMFVVVVGFLLAICGAAIVTSVHVYSNHKYNLDGFQGNLGVVALGLVWGSVAAQIVAIVTTWTARSIYLTRPRPVLVPIPEPIYPDEMKEHLDQQRRR